MSEKKNLFLSLMARRLLHYSEKLESVKNLPEKDLVSALPLLSRLEETVRKSLLEPAAAAVENSQDQNWIQKLIRREKKSKPRDLEEALLQFKESLQQRGQLRGSLDQKKAAIKTAVATAKINQEESEFSAHSAPKIQTPLQPLRPFSKNSEAMPVFRLQKNKKNIRDS